jgi:ATP-dependent exoDNAse (exonuclease V) beta subunit
MRLLYVAVTRAEHAVLVFGARAWISDRANEWYSWGELPKAVERAAWRQRSGPF